MARLSRKRFFRFCVELPERGDVDEMLLMLAAHPEHREEYLHGVRERTDGGQYSVMPYSTWLCRFEQWQKARKVVSWLLDEHPFERTIWTALALDDEVDLRAHLDADAMQARAHHPLFQDTALEIARPHQRTVLLEYNADDGSVFTAVLLGQDARVLRLVDEDPALLTAGKPHGDKAPLLHHALVCGRDEVACALIERGAPTGPDPNGNTALAMAANWGNPRATAVLLEQGADPNERAHGFTALSMAIARGTPHPDSVRALLAAGARPAPVQGTPLKEWAENRGLDDVAALL